MSELTKEKLEEHAENGTYYRSLSDEELQSMARELLALRTLRDAGDEEVEKISVEMEACFVAQNDDVLLTGEERSDAQSTLIDLARQIRDIAITRGQQLREAREEIERLKGEYASLESNWLHEKENVEWQKTKVRNLRMAADAAGRVDLQSQIATLAAERDGLNEALSLAGKDVDRLTAERDEARTKLEKQIDITYEAKAVVSQMQKELAALKSAPGMEEVDALVAKEDSLSAKMSAGHYLLFINDCDIARRSIASREEVVGL